MVTFDRKNGAATSPRLELEFPLLFFLSFFVVNLFKLKSDNNLRAIAALGLAGVAE